MSIDRRSVLLRAWEIFRELWAGSGNPWATFGRFRFAAALRQAWAERRQAAAFAAIPADMRAERIAALKRERAYLPYADAYRRSAARTTAIDAELRLLAA